MRGINLVQTIEFALAFKYCHVKENGILKTTAVDYQKAINSDLESKYGRLWFEQEHYDAKKSIYTYHDLGDEQFYYILKEKYIQKPELLDYVITNYPLDIVKAANLESSLNIIDLLKDKDNHIKMKILRRR